jgi:hypothetical protein
VADWWQATADERQALTEATLAVKTVIEQGLRPDGYNVGVNVGTAGGQTVFHLHLHVIPRYAGDVPQPRGGVRWVIPGRADYLRTSGPSPQAVPCQAAPAVQGILRGFREAQIRYGDYGARDTEPDGVAQAYLACALGLEGGLPRLPTTREDWQLYDMEGADLAAEALTEALQEAEGLLRVLLARDPAGTLRELRDRLWRL